MKLTEPQRRLLEKARDYTHNDSSGRGYFTFGTDMSVAVRLERRGMLTRCAAWPTLTYVKITELGRATLERKP